MPALAAGSGLAALLGAGRAACLWDYAKAAMFLIGMGLLAILFVLPRSSFDRKKLIGSLLLYLAIASPLIMAMSRREGKLSFGAAGPLKLRVVRQQAAHLGRVDRQHSPGARDSQHPPRTLLEKPRTLKPWYDPSYWYAGAQPKFNLSQKFAASKVVVQELNKILLDSLPFAAASYRCWASCCTGESPRVAAQALVVDRMARGRRLDLFHGAYRGAVRGSVPGDGLADRVSIVAPPVHEGRSPGDLRNRSDCCDTASVLADG
jgi:hypothetical protein